MVQSKSLSEKYWAEFQEVEDSKGLGNLITNQHLSLTKRSPELRAYLDLENFCDSLAYEEKPI